jgi:acetylornithine deacetylase/succinyl-diaminopimelate desuccinylase-like protein
MMSRVQDAWQFVDDSSDQMIGDLQRLIQQKSISSSGEGVHDCADLLASMMNDIGIDARVMPTEGLPIVFGYVRADTDPDAAPTLLIYTHYDVQPADPEDEWDSPPWEARLVGDRIIGRGATDAKGNLMAHLKAVEALKASGGLPINIKFIFDGEEESGSPSLPGFVDSNRDLLMADAALSFDGGFDAGNVPRVNLGSSGLLFVQLRAQGGKNDLHSARARLVPNPAWKLVWALNSMKDRESNILIDGFYDDVRPPTGRERELLEQAGWDDSEQRASLGVDEFVGGVTGIDALQQLLFTPTCNIAGFASGYVGEGRKTLLPAKAAVNIDFRLVADQDPRDILAKVKAHLRKHRFDDIEVIGESGIEPSRTSPDDPFVQVVVAAADEVYGRPPTVRPTGDASGRQATWLAGKLGIPGAGSAVGPPDWRGHAANEFMTVDHFLNGIKYAATIWSRWAKQRAGSNS